MLLHHPDFTLAAISACNREHLVTKNNHAYHLHNSQEHGSSYSSMLQNPLNLSEGDIKGLNRLNGPAFVMPRVSSPMVVTHSNQTLQSPSKPQPREQLTPPMTPSSQNGWGQKLSPSDQPEIKQEVMDYEDSSPITDSNISPNSSKSNSQEDERQQQHDQNLASMHDENSNPSLSSGDDDGYCNPGNTDNVTPSIKSKIKWDYTCVACNWTAIDEIELCNHVQTKHEDTMASDGELMVDNRVPRMNSQGKLKLYRCKQCKIYGTVTKFRFWEHTGQHIKNDRRLYCQKCNFVTEFKHHLEYHMRNHEGKKPFKCDQCNYRCVNKSMLNSHLKSHSQVYQYRCADCSYAVKYCHSLKLHLRKYNHNPDIVLNPDGSPNPLPIVDVYGSRRGPKVSKKDEASIGGVIPHTHNTTGFTPLSQVLHPIVPFSLFSGIFDEPKPVDLTKASIPIPPLSFIPTMQMKAHPPSSTLTPIQTPPIVQTTSLENFAITTQPIVPTSTISEKLALTQPIVPTSTISEKLALRQPIVPTSTTLEKLALRQPIVPTSTTLEKLAQTSALVTTPTTPIAAAAPTSSRRKGKAFKLERIALELQHNLNSDDEEQQQQTEFQAEEELIPPQKCISPPCDQEVSKSDPIYKCNFCEILFSNLVMYTVHMGYHGYNDPFTCNMCGQKSTDKITFYLHIGRNSHKN